jgi:hypothetical protein
VIIASLKLNLMKSIFSVSGGMVLFLLISFCFIFSCTGEKEVRRGTNDAAKLELKGQVRLLTETIFKTENNSGEIQKGGMLSKKIIMFNKSGNLLDEQNFGPDGRLDWKVSFAYDDKGNLISRTTFDKTSDLLRKEVYRYDMKGNVISVASLGREGDLENEITFLYDARGNEVERNSFTTGVSQWNISLYYDAKGNLKKDSYTRLIQSQRTRVLSQYDEKGNKIIEEYFNSDGRLFTRNRNKFDEKGNLIRTDVYNSDDSLVYMSVYEYNDNGRLVGRKNGSSSENLETRQSIRYDEENNIIEETYSYGLRESRSNFRYDRIDRHGNWLTRTRIESSVKTGKENLEVITERVIDYY